MWLPFGALKGFDFGSDGVYFGPSRLWLASVFMIVILSSFRESTIAPSL